MSGRIRLFASCLALIWATTAVTAAAETSSGADPRQIWQLLDYLAVDYAGAVSDDRVVNESEFKEMQEFAASVRTGIATLPKRPAQGELN